MGENSVDPRFEKLVALLYGELSEIEAKQLREQMATDDALRREFEDLSAARAFLADWEVPERAPHFVFLTDEPVGGRQKAVGRNRLSGWRERFRGFLTATPWAVATAAILVAFLAWSDFRVDRTNGSIVFRFGGSGQEAIQTAERMPTTPQGTTAPIGTVASSGGLEPGRQVDVTGPQDGSAYLTRAEFNELSNGMARTMVALLNEYSLRRDQELTGLLQGAFGRVSDRQANDYAELRGRIDALQQGVSMQRTITDSRLDYLTRTGAQGSLTPGSDPSDSVSVEEGDQQ